MSPAASSFTKFRQPIVNNFWLKLMALVIAFLLWLAVSSAPITEIAFSIPVELRNLPNELELTSGNIPQAEVRLRGPSRVVRELRPSELHVVLDLAGFSVATAGDHTFELIPRQVKVPAGIEVVQVVPSYLRLSFDKRGTRKLEVRAQMSGRIAPGYRVASVKVEPAEVMVVGPEMHLALIQAATTDPIDASGVMGSQTFVAAAHVQDPLVRFTQPSSVRVTVVTEKTK